MLLLTRKIVSGNDALLHSGFDKSNGFAVSVLYFVASPAVAFSGISNVTFRNVGILQFCIQAVAFTDGDNPIYRTMKNNGWRTFFIYMT